MALKALFYPDVKFDTLFIPYIYKEIYLDGVYLDIFNTRKDMVCLDIGANIGIVTQYMRDFSKKIYAVEPAKDHFEALTKNIEYNKWDNVVPIKATIAPKDGEMTLLYDKYNRTTYAIDWPGIKRDRDDGKEEVRTICFETLLNENKIDKVDFCKFDVEGFEEPILMGDSFRRVVNRIDAIEVEFHFNDFPKIVEHMIRLGYKARRFECSSIIILFTK